MRRYRLTEAGARQGSLILVSPQYALDREPAPEQLEALPAEMPDSSAGQLPCHSALPSILLERQAAACLRALLSRLSAPSGILAVSGFRPLAEQTALWDQSREENGAAYTRKFVAKPGHSEHQTGLAVDLAERRDCLDPICPAFPYTGVCQEFREAAPSLGFVERYPAGKESITGIGPEPWHFRYVGLPHSRILAEQGMTLEEYLAFLREATSPSAPFRHRSPGWEEEIFYLPWQGQDGQHLAVPEEADCRISGTNEGGFVVCLRRKAP